MKVILLKDVRNVGRKDEVKIVADGFASNFLLPQNLVVAATPEKIAALEKTKGEQAAKEIALADALDEHIRSLNSQRLEISARATEKGGLFKSIQSTDLVRFIKEKKEIDLPESVIHLEAPIKTTGEHHIELRSKKAKAEMIIAISAA